MDLTCGVAVGTLSGAGDPPHAPGMHPLLRFPSFDADHLRDGGREYEILMKCHEAHGLINIVGAKTIGARFSMSLHHLLFGDGRVV